MSDNGTTSADRAMCDRILAGVAAAGELQQRFRQKLEGFLVGMCDKGDGRSQEKAVEIASQVLADCFIKSPSLLERWQGDDNLEAFLRTAASNRLKSWWSSAEKQRTEVNSESLSITHASEGRISADGGGMEEEEISIAHQALRVGVAAAERTCAEGVVFLRLKGLHGVDQRAISKCWGHHEAQTSRRIKEAMSIIREVAKETAETKGYELGIELLQEALQRDPAILLGSGELAAGLDEDRSLRLLASGKADAAMRRHAVEIMCANPRLLAFFASLLNRGDESEVVIPADPGLAGMGARLETSLRKSVEILHPVESRAFITPAIKAFFADALRQADADGGTLWLLCPGDATLEAVFNPIETDIAGKRQPLVSGIVSLVMATGEAACVSKLSSHSRHSPAIDIALGRPIQSMIAVPFLLAGSTRGVVTAVRWKQEEPFQAADSETLGRLSEIMSELMTAAISRRILEG
jgi:DNA-directed RNA polymerase specialized sigma24 family protein